VLGGLLIADEVIDVFLPVLYFAVCKGRWRKLHGISLFNRRSMVERRHDSVTVS
jgi:Cu(I)/Ag(I) efflux system membrane protein CusA/SilA